jgi:hypothetical protein
MVGNVAYNVLTADEGWHYEIPPELTEEEQLQVVVIVSAEQQRQEDYRRYPGINDATAISIQTSPLGCPPIHSDMLRSGVCDLTHTDSFGHQNGSAQYFNHENVLFFFGKSPKQTLKL